MVDANVFPALASRHQVSGVPHTVINDGAGNVVGAVPEADLAAAIREALQKLGATPWAELASTAPLPELENAIKSTGFYRNKAKSIRGAMREIVEKHGGALECRSEVHRGTTFTITLPRATAVTS